MVEPLRPDEQAALAEILGAGVRLTAEDVARRSTAFETVAQAQHALNTLVASGYVDATFRNPYVHIYGRSLPEFLCDLDEQPAAR